MIPNSQFKFTSFLWLLLFLGACANDPESVQEIPQDSTENVTVDTLLQRLSDKQRYFQHFMLEIPPQYQQDIDSFANWIVENEPGALKFLDWDVDSISRLKLKLDTLDIIQPLYYAHYFDYLELPNYPFWDVSASNTNLTWTNVFLNDRIGLVDFGAGIKKTAAYEAWLTAWKSKNGCGFVTDHFQDKNVKTEFERFNITLKATNHSVALNLEHFDTVQLEKFRISTQFQGLFFVSTAQDAINRQLEGGADFVIVRLNENADGLPYKNWKPNKDQEQIFIHSTERILKMKQTVVRSPIMQGIEEQILATRLNLLFGSNALLKNGSKDIPLSNGATVFSADKLPLSSQLKNENNWKVVHRDLNGNIAQIEKEKGTKIIFINDSVNAETKAEINALTSTQQVIVCFSNPADYPALSQTANLVFYSKPSELNFDYSILLQQLSGQLAFNADFSSSDSLIKGLKTNKLKLARTQPEFVGMSSDTLKQIDWAVQGAINGMAFPGCQVLIAKEGCIVYDKSFGYHTYERDKAVTATSMYDLASLTKVVSTTLVGMKLWEMKGYDLNDSLGEYLPDTLRKYLTYPSTIRNLTFQELFIHKSGMPAGFPIIGYMQYTNAETGRYDKYYCDLADSVYNIEVAENFFLDRTYQDSLWIRLNQIWLDKSKPYKYSDVNMNTLYFMFKSILQNNPEKYGFTVSKKDEDTRNLYIEFLYDKFYTALGMEHTKYKPLKHFNKNEIVPTEKESYWRKQLLQGHVHDPNAALYGGIGGNAGIFSTTNDLAILAEMWLQKGTYGGQQYLKPETVSKFVVAQPNSHRGLGFNKPSLNTSAFGCADDAPPETYGHTGFTGTCIWIDPVNKLTYVFLSNRVHPTVNNRIYQFGIRARTHQFAYDAQLFD